MSKITIVGGDIIEKIGGDDLSFAKEGIINSGSLVIQTGKEKGVSFGKNKDTPFIQNSDIIEYYRFNPISSYSGVYGAYLNNIYIRREKWNAKQPLIEKNRSFEPYLFVFKEWDTSSKDKIGISILQNQYFGIAIHHSGNSNNNTINKVQNEHINEKERADIGYHFGIDTKGNIYEGRYIGVKGSHLDSYNTGVIGIVFLADFDHNYIWDINGNDTMSIPMLKSAFILIEALKEQFTKIITLGGHKEWKNNTERRCPGEYGLKYVKLLRKSTYLKTPKETGHG